MHAKRMTHDERRQRRQQMAERIGGGDTLAQVARAFGVSISTVFAACREHDVVVPEQRSTPVATTPAVA